MPAAEPPCALRSLAEDEPLAGTASRIRRWLMIEKPGPWGHDALLGSELDRETGRRLRAFGERHRVRVLLVKRRDRPREGPRRCFAAFTGPREHRLVALEAARPEDLLELDLAGLADRGWRGLGEPLEAPLFVVCTHGKHDPCCAREGLPVARALAGRPDVWEATHVGGDRFAGNIVAFPHGLYFGRVTPATAPGVVESYAAGRIDLERYRGRAGHPPAVQAAERFLREREGLAGVDDLALVRHERAGDRHSVTLRAADATFEVEVAEGSRDARPLTCKATHPHRPRSFQVSGGEARSTNRPSGS